MDDYQVLTLCTTYNQSKYIEDALNGFVMQKTNFPFVCVIIDDASTDGEQGVIKTFLEREFDFTEDNCKETDDAQVIVAKHKTNTNCTFAVYFLKENHYSIKRSKDPYINPWREKCKYEAWCEGDDYWIEPLKLQKQYEILENNPDVSMVFHKAKILKEISCGGGARCTEVEDREYTATELYQNWNCQTASIFCRLDYLKYPLKDDTYSGFDAYIIERCAHIGKVLGISEFMSVYRVQSNGMSYGNSGVRSLIMNGPQFRQSMALNFPKIDKTFLQQSTAGAYWSRASLPNNPERYKDFFRAVKLGSWKETSRQVLKRIYNRLTKLLTD